MKLAVQRLRPALDLFSIALPQGRVQPAHPGRDFLAGRFLQDVRFITQKLLRMPKQKLAVLYVSRSKHGVND